MRLTIEKSASSQRIRCELVYDTAKKPVVVEFEPDELERLLDMIQTVRKAKKLKFELEL